MIFDNFLIGPMTLDIHPSTLHSMHHDPSNELPSHVPFEALDLSQVHRFCWLSNLGFRSPQLCLYKI